MKTKTPTVAEILAAQDNVLAKARALKAEITASTAEVEAETAMARAFVDLLDKNLKR